MSAPPNYSEYRLDKTADDPLKDITIDFNAVRGFLRRSLRLIVLFMLIGGALGFAYSTVAVKEYVASTRVLYGTLKGADASGQTTLDPGFGDNAVDAQIELIRSNAVMKAVIAELDLTGDRGRAEFGRGSWMPAFLESEPKPLEEAGLMEAINKKLKVERVGRSQVVQISYTSSDPQFAADMANAFGRAYVAEQLKANASLARSTASWLSAQVDEQRKQIAIKETQIQEFKQKNNLVGPDGRLVGGQEQLTATNAQLLQAEADIARIRTMRDRLVQTAQNDPATVFSDAPANSPVFALRDRYLALEQRYNRLRGRLGERHRLVQDLRDELDILKRQLSDEAGRAVAVANSEVESAAARIAWLRASRTNFLEALRGADVASGQLTQMQLEADALRKNYENNLERLQREQHNESYPVSNARVIEAAEVPERSISRSRGILVGIGAAFGLLCALGLSLLWDMRRRKPREAEAV